MLDYTRFLQLYSITKEKLVTLIKLTLHLTVSNPISLGKNYV